MSAEPDYEAIWADREEARGERWLDRMDRRYGRVEDWLPKQTGTPHPTSKSEETDP